MTEQEWLECADSTPMLRFLHDPINTRKQRLFAVGCCRLIWGQLRDERSRQAIEAAEHFADRQADRKQLHRAFRNASAVAACFASHTFEYAAAHAAEQSAESDRRLISHAAYWAAMSAARAALASYSIGELSPQQRQSDLLRCIVGNPFRPVTVDPTWLTSTVVSLATAIYDERAFDRLPILADALEDAGCDNADILNHCRQPGEHVRGCWAVDLVLGRK